jgi:HAMP domain-containing protein
MVERSARPWGGTASPKVSRHAVVWLAVLAVVAQAVLFEFAMAARETAAASKRAAVAHHDDHQVPRGDQDAPRHKHGGKDCPFCVARATHATPSLPHGPELTSPCSAVTFAPPLLRARIRARRRPARFRSRSPPRALRLTIA